MSAPVWLAACGGGGGAPAPAGQAAPAANPTPGTTFLGEPAGLFNAQPSQSVVRPLAPYSISTDARTKPYEELAVVYSWDGKTFIVDFPLETAPGQLQVYSPVGRLTEAGLPQAGPVQVAVVRISGDKEELSNVFTLAIEQPAVSATPAAALASALSGAIGRYRSETISRTLVPGTPAQASLAAVNENLYSTQSAKTFAPLAADANEEKVLRLYLEAMFSALELRPQDYIRPVLRPATQMLPQAASDDLNDAILAEYNIDVDQLSRDMGNKVRESAGTLTKVAGLVAATALLVSSPTVAAAIGTGAIILGVGMGVGLVGGFLADNLAVFGGLKSADQLRVRDTVGFWLNNVTGYALPRFVKNVLPSATRVNSVRERAGAYLYEVTSSEIIGGVQDAARQAITNLKNLDIGSAWGARASGISNQWQQWRTSGFRSEAFPSSAYQSAWTPAPTPAPAPAPGGPYRCSDCARGAPQGR
jgi:hypothetical protein